MSNFDLTFCKVYVYAKGWPGINLGASHEFGTHPRLYTSFQSPKRGKIDAVFENGSRG